MPELGVRAEPTDLVLDRVGFSAFEDGVVVVEVEVEVEVVWLDPPGARGRVDTNSVVAVGTDPSVLVALPDPEPDPPSCAAVSSSSAAFSESCAWSTANCAEVGSSVASSWPSCTCWPMCT